jgi:hypothetical protein
MKKFLLIFFGLAVFSASWSQVQRVDTVAVMILNHMSDIIGGLNSCSFKLNTSFDATDLDFGTIKQTGTDEVSMVGPDKMLVHSYGDKGHQGYWYNGGQVIYYSFTENNYAILEAQPDIMSTIASINLDYGIDFPAADFFFPTFTDDIISEYPSIVFAGKKDVDGQECFHLIVSNQHQNIQFWIANDAYSLPKKFVVTYKNHENMQYEATFSNWILNTEIPDAVFEFLPPPQANRIFILPLTSK